MSVLLAWVSVPGRTGMGHDLTFNTDARRCNGSCVDGCRLGDVGAPHDVVGNPSNLVKPRMSDAAGHQCRAASPLGGGRINRRRREKRCRARAEAGRCSRRRPRGPCGARWRPRWPPTADSKTVWLRREPGRPRASARLAGAAAQARTRRTYKSERSRVTYTWTYPLCLPVDARKVT